MTPAPPAHAPASAPVLLRISEAAAQAGTSTRTLRYYEELGLLRPSRYSVGGARRYTEEDVARLKRIRELQELLGFDLGEIGDIMRNEDQLADLRSEVQAGVTPERHRQILAEAMEINDRLRGLVKAKQERLQTMMQELDTKARRYRARAKELSAGSRSTPGSGSSGKPSVQVEGLGMNGIVRLQVVGDQADELLHCAFHSGRMSCGICSP